jgi:hypothetical protein
VGESDERKLGSISTSGFDAKLRASSQAAARLRGAAARTICPAPPPFITRPMPSGRRRRQHQRPFSSGRAGSSAPPEGVEGQDRHARYDAVRVELAVPHREEPAQHRGDRGRAHSRPAATDRVGERASAPLTGEGALGTDARIRVVVGRRDATRRATLRPEKRCTRRRAFTFINVGGRVPRVVDVDLRTSREHAAAPRAGREDTPVPVSRPPNAWQVCAAPITTSCARARAQSNAVEGIGAKWRSSAPS